RMGLASPPGSERSMPPTSGAPALRAARPTPRGRTISSRKGTISMGRITPLERRTAVKSLAATALIADQRARVTGAPPSAAARDREVLSHWFARCARSLRALLDGEVAPLDRRRAPD